MRRFFTDQQTIHEDLVRLSASESRHIATVLRLVEGTDIELFDGTGIVYAGRLESVSKKEVFVRIYSRRNENAPIAPPIFLFQSLLKGKKMDFLMQKATEMGVHTIQPVQTKYSENKPANQEKQKDRWLRIILEACKQSGRNRPMNIKPVIDLNHFSCSDCGAKLVFWEGEHSVSLSPDLLAGNQPVCLLLGPEGGFHEEEIQLVTRRGFQPVSLGNLILRAETATLAALAIVQHLVGGFSSHPPEP